MPQSRITVVSFLTFSNQQNPHATLTKSAITTQKICIFALDFEYYLN
jgi:hypothetical protein